MSEDLNNCLKNKKYELTNETIEFNGKTLYRIRALRDFGDVKAGDLGGFVESENNLSHEGNCWVSENSKVLENGFVEANAVAKGNSIISGNGKATGNSVLNGNTVICNNGVATDNAYLDGKTVVYENSSVGGNAKLKDIIVKGDSNVKGDIDISGEKIISEGLICSLEDLKHDTVEAKLTNATEKLTEKKGKSSKEFEDDRGI